MCRLALTAMVGVFGFAPGNAFAASAVDAGAAVPTTPPGAASIGGTPQYRPPVDAPIIDPFRPPPHRYGPGNRGLTYGVVPLTPVRSAAAGTVIFAGPVAGALHVTIRHADGLRTTYSFLASISVVVGQVVDGGAPVGRSGEVFHFGVRTPDGTYLDPELLWSGRWEPRLVPGGDDGASVPPEPVLLEALVHERIGPLAARVASGGAPDGGAGPGAIADFERRLRLWEHYATELGPSAHLRRLREGLRRWTADHGDCTRSTQDVSAPSERRIVVEVGGIGSTSDAAAIDRLDVNALGYDPGDVLRFSYAGGRVPAVAPPPAGGAADPAPDGPFAGITTTDYDAVASQEDLEVSGRRLAALVDEVARAAPGVPIDVIAHSQGGVVARIALAGGPDDAAPAEVQRLITLGSPHAGADLATAVEAVGSDPAGAGLLERARTDLGIDLDPSRPAARQLSEVSPLMVGLDDRPVADGIAFTSIAARGDLVVPLGRTDAVGARRSTVSISGISAHDRLPGSPEATREVLLAVRGLPPTCRDLGDTVVDLAVGEGIASLEDALGATAAGVALTVPG